MKKTVTNISHMICLILVLTLTACANFSAVDKPISKVTPHGADQIVSQRSSDLLVLVAFSGGGTRAGFLCLRRMAR